MSVGGQHQLRFGDPPLGPSPLPSRLDCAEDALAATTGQEAGGVVAPVKEVGRPAAQLGLDGPQRRKSLGVQSVFVKVEACCLLGYSPHVGPTVEDKAEGTTLGPPDVAVALGCQVG